MRGQVSDVRVSAPAVSAQVSVFGPVWVLDVRVSASQAGATAWVTAVVMAIAVWAMAPRL
jgi:hypothetical protein